MKAFLAVVKAMLLLAASAQAAAAAGGLALGFVATGKRLDLTSISTLTEPPRALPAVHAQWTAVALDAAGGERWQWSFAAPRRFHAGSEDSNAFVALIPAVDAGTRVTLFDQHGKVRWTQVLGKAALAAAKRREVQLRSSVQEASTATSKLARARTGSALDRQIKAQAIEPPGAEQARFRDSMTWESTQAAPKTDSALRRQFSEQPMPLSPQSVDLQARAPHTATAAAKAIVSVAVRVVDDLGQAPAQTFAARLLERGNVIGEFTVNSAGELTLPLETGVAYQLDFLPAAPLVAVRHTFTYSGTQLPAFVLQHGWILDVKLRDTTGNAIGGNHRALLFGFDGSAFHQFVLTPTSAPGQLRFAVPKSSQWRHHLQVATADDTYGYVHYEIGTLTGSREQPVQLTAAANIIGRVVAADGSALAGGGRLDCSGPDRPTLPSYSGRAFFDSSGDFVLRLPTGLHMACQLYVSAPMLDREFAVNFVSGEPVELEVLRGVPVSFLLRDSDSQPITGSISGLWFDAETQTVDRCSGNPCSLLVPSDRAVEMTFSFNDVQYSNVRLDARQYLANSEHVVVVPRRWQISGRVTDDARPAGDVRVRVYDEHDQFVVSVASSTFEFRLAEGNYRFEADANPEHASSDSWLFRMPVRSELVHVDRDVTLNDLMLPTARGEVTLTVDRPCGLRDQAVRLALTAPDGRRIEQISYQPQSIPPLPRPAGQCASQHVLGLSPGAYEIDVAPFGWEPQRIETTVTANGAAQQHALAFTSAGRTQVWNGRLLDSQQRPISQALVSLVDANQEQVFNTSPDANGHFELPFVRNWGVDIALFDRTDMRSLRRTIRYASAPPPATLRLDRFDLTAAPESGMLRLYGNGDRRRRYNLLFIAEGYTDVAETFTDRNGNGVWDGVIWYDLNGSGVYEQQHDRVWSQGSAFFPAEGSDPRAQSEPFVDQNGDGLLSLNDPALFVANAEAFMRSLLGSDVWQARPDAFNAYLVFAPSAQAGHDVRSASGTLQISRDTLYGAALDRSRGTLEVDRNAVVEQALAFLPELDVVIALVNEPIPGGRANVAVAQPGSMVSPGGLHNTHPNSMVPSHEMGHFVGGLCDEYSEFVGIHPGYLYPQDDLGCANATISVDTARVPWRDWLPAGSTPLPSKDRNGSVGLFEGASYFRSGAYRPSLNSTMRQLSPFFNPPSRQALTTALRARAPQLPWTPFRPGQSATRLDSHHGE